jgi:hypothetical protein
MKKGRSFAAAVAAPRNAGLIVFDHGVAHDHRAAAVDAAAVPAGLIALDPDPLGEGIGLVSTVGRLWI